MEPETKPEKKARKPLSKKTKLILIISSVVVGLGGLVALLVLVVFKKTEPVVVLTDTEYLIQTESWEKQGAPTVIWTFHDDQKGELTTNKSNYYDMKWAIEQENDKQILKVITSWLYELTDSFEFSLDRENQTFTVKNLADEGESVFVPLGTQAEHPTEEAPEDVAKEQE